MSLRPPRVPVPEGKLPGCYVYEVSQDSRHRLFARILGWQKPVSLNARTVLPPLKGRPVYGPAAKRYMHAIPHTIRKPWEHSVARGLSPLNLYDYRRREANLARRRAQKAREAMPPSFGRIELTGGLRIVR